MISRCVISALGRRENHTPEHNRLMEALANVVEACEKIDCQCDARWSGRDEAEYRACGCPNCSCEHRKALYALEIALKGVGIE